MTNEEKAKEIAEVNKMTYLEMENDGGVYDVDSFDECENSAMQMAEWKDNQNKWHEIANGDLPKEEGDYLLVMKIKYARRECISKPYMNVSYFSMKDGWKDPYDDDFAEETIFVAWMELPEYTEE